MKAHDRSEWIDLYLMNRLSEREKKEFEEKLENDKDLREDLDRRGIIISGIQAGLNRELKDILAREESKLSKNSRVIRLRFVSGIAAGLAVLVASYFMFLNHGPDDKEIYFQYYKPYPNIESPLERTDAQTADPFQLYETGRYQSAIEGFSALLKADDKNTAAMFYKGLSHMELGQQQQASVYFRQIIGQDENTYNIPSRWYLSLCYISLDDREDALKILAGLAEGQGKFAKDAGKLMKELGE